MNEGLELTVDEGLHKLSTVLDELMEKGVCSFTALVIRDNSLLFGIARAGLLLDDNRTASSTFLLSLEVAREEELFEDLANEVLLLNDAVAHSFIRLGNDLSCQGNQAN